MSAPAPIGECTCPPDATDYCEYCHAMTTWAHYELYPDDDAPLFEREEHCAEDED